MFNTRAACLAAADAACRGCNTTDLDADAESERLVRDIALCHAQASGSSEKKRSRGRKPNPKSSKKARQLPPPLLMSRIPCVSFRPSANRRRREDAARERRESVLLSPTPIPLIPPPHLNPAFINRPHTSDAVPIGAVHGIQHANGREAVESVANSHNERHDEDEALADAERMPWCFDKSSSDESSSSDDDKDEPPTKKKRVVQLHED